jgi:two-component system NtrC family sensor kinase
VTLPASLKVTVPLIPARLRRGAQRAEFALSGAARGASGREDHRERLLQELSRLQSTLEYLLLKGELEGARREVAILASNRNYTVVALTDDQRVIIAATRRAWLGRPAAEVLPKFDVGPSSQTAPGRGTQVTDEATWMRCSATPTFRWAGHPRAARLAHRAAVLRIRLEARQERGTRADRRSVALLDGVGDGARGGLMDRLPLPADSAHQPAGRSGRTACRGNLAARSALKGRDELARLSRAFDAMADKVEHTQTRLQEDIAKRIEVQEALRASEAQYRAMFDASIDGLALRTLDGQLVDSNPALWRIYGYTREAFLALSPEDLAGA